MGVIEGLGEDASLLVRLREMTVVLELEKHLRRIKVDIFRRIKGYLKKLGIGGTYIRFHPATVEQIGKGLKTGHNNIFIAAKVQIILQKCPSSEFS